MRKGGARPGGSESTCTKGAGGRNRDTTPCSSLILDSAQHCHVP